MAIVRNTGGWFNVKMTSYQHRKSHCGDKTILRPSNLHNGISYTGKTKSLYWIRPQDTTRLLHSHSIGTASWVWDMASNWLASPFCDWLVGLTIGWDCLSRNALWAQVTGGNCYCFVCWFIFILFLFIFSFFFPRGQWQSLTERVWDMTLAHWCPSKTISQFPCTGLSKGMLWKLVEIPTGYTSP